MTDAADPGVPCAIVITTIHHPTDAVQAVAAGAHRLAAEVILIGDQASPVDFSQDGASYLDLADQRRTGFAFAELAPVRHYARKNIGYLEAMRRGARLIVETDDDNAPLDSFWQPRSLSVTAPCLRDAGWVNMYRHFTDRLIWPRGLPLDEVRRPVADFRQAPVEHIACPIQQGLADGEPDVDALYRLLMDAPADFRQEPPVVLGPGSWCPINSQNTSWWPQVFPLLYLPSHCSFRMTDIWRGFVAQRIAGALGWGVLFTAPTVHQLRNPHELMRDFVDEIPGYRDNAGIRLALEKVVIPSAIEGIPAALRGCYEALTGLGCIPAGELPLLDAWLGDIAAMRIGPDGG